MRTAERKQSPSRDGESPCRGRGICFVGRAQSSVQAPREAWFRRILQPRDGGYLPRDCIGVSTLQEAAEAAFADG